MSSIGVARVDKLDRKIAGRVSTINPVGGYRFGNGESLSDPMGSLTHRRHPEQRYSSPVWGGGMVSRQGWLMRFLLLVTLLSVGLGSTVLADGTLNLGVTEVGAQVDQTFYAYANPGERVTYSFTRSAPAPGTLTPSNVTISVYSPLGLVRSQTLTTIGQTFAFSELVSASTTGIWTIVLDFTANYGSAFLSPYSVDVTTTTNVLTRINGRVYTDLLYIRQNNIAHPIDFDLYMISEFGYKYTTGLRGYMGYGSALQTTRYGVRKGGTCVSVYQSVEYSGYTSGDECGGLYKQFFTPIDASMPAASQRYDVATSQTVSEWLHPPVAPNPTITGLTYIPSTIGNPASGVFTAMIANYAGNASLQVDVNNNGVYTDAIDRTIPFNVLTGQNTIGWDGVDGAGNVVGCSTNLRARIYIDKVAEIHFTYFDLEQLSSGLRVTRTNGAGSPNSIIYWDDTHLSTTFFANGLAVRNTTPIKDGTAGINSTPNATVGVHGWAYDQQSWGNERFIENWTYLPNLAIQQAINFSVACDLGDAPNSYATLLANNGPAHKLTSSLFIGALAADGELNGIPTVNATGDDANGVDDEDAITTAPPVLVACSDVYSLTVPVTNTTGQTAYLRGWVDFNRNGIFDTNEFTSVNIPYDPANTTALATLMWSNLGAVGLSVGQSYIRLRVSSTNFVLPTGTLNDGEVEDYPVTILPRLTFSAVAMNASSCAVADGSITLTATGSSGNYEYSLNGVDFTPFTSPFIIPNLGRNGYRVTVRDQTYASCIGDTIININAPGCCDFFDNQTITGTAFNPGAGITVQYLLTNASGQIVSVQSTPSFPPQTLGDYYIYTLAYDSGSPAPTGVTVGQNVSGIAGCCYRIYPPDPITVCGCPTITLINTSYSVCAGQPLPFLQVTTTAVAPTQVEFVYFTTPQASAAAVYGTPTGVLGAASSASNVAALTNVDVPTTAGTYYIYARISPAPDDPACRPYVQIPLSVSVCPEPCDVAVTASASNETVCMGSPVALSAEATPAGSYTYTWSGPNSYSATGADVTIASAVLTNNGTYTVVAADANGCSATATVGVTVNPTPAFTVTPTNTTSCAGDSGILTLNGLLASTSYTLEYSVNGNPFGPLTLLTNAGGQLILTGLAAGAYTNIIVSLNGCPSAPQLATIADPGAPVAPVITVTPSQTICLGQSATMTASGVAGATFIWTGTDLSSTTGSPVTATPATAGTFIYTVTQSVAGCTSPAASVTVTVTNPPSVTAVANSATVCVSSPLSLSAIVNPTGTYTYAWTGPNGYTGTGANPTVSATAAITQSGTYTVVVTNAAGCSGTAVVLVTVDNCCDLVASIAPVSVTNCTATTGGLVITYTGSQTYQYNLNGGAFQPLGTSPSTVNNLAPGSYTVIVQAIGDLTCTTTLTGFVEINPISVLATSNSPQCAGNTILLEAIPGDGVSGTYQWSGPNGFSGTGQSVSIPNATTLASGIYTVTLTTALGCVANASTTVVIANQPSLTLTAGSGQTICSGQSTTINVDGSNGATVTWSNSFGQTGTGTSINFAGIENVSGVPQSITYVVNADAGSCSDQTTYVLTINPAPVIQVTPSAAVYCDIEQVSIRATAFPNTATVNWTRTPATPAPPAASGIGTGTVTIQQTLPAANYTYSFSATGTNGCSSQPINTSVIVQQ